MNYEVHEKGWGVLCHTPIEKLNHNDILLILELLMKNTIIIWRNQNLSAQQIHDFCSYIGRHDYAFTPEEYDKFTPEHKSSFVDDYSGMIRVSGKKDQYDNEGVFGHTEELSWHSDKIHDVNRKPFTFLYAAEGTQGSVTEFTNHIVAYDLLSDDNKFLYNDATIRFGLGRWRKDLTSTAYQKTVNLINNIDHPDHNLVVTNPYGDKGLFISPLQTESISFVDDNDIIDFCDKILNHITQPDCVYVHEWEDGDVVMSDQILGIHKRNKFDGMSNRELYRMSFDLSNIMTDIEYAGYKGKIV